jgi:hypothetical protein
MFRYGENKPSEPKNGIWGQNQYGRVIYPSFGNFIRSKKNILLEVKKAKISLQSPGSPEANVRAFSSSYKELSSFDQYCGSYYFFYFLNLLFNKGLIFFFWSFQVSGF